MTALIWKNESGWSHDLPGSDLVEALGCQKRR